MIGPPIVAGLLALAVLVCLYAAACALRLGGYGRLHAAALVNVAGGAAMAAAVIAADGATPRAAKAVAIWLIASLSGALGSHVSGRAIHLRGGGRR